MKKITYLVLFLVIITNYGFAQWVQFTNYNVNSLYKYGATIYLSYNNGVMTSTNEGSNWSQVSMLNGINYSFVYKNASSMAAGTATGIKYSTTGETWQSTNVTWETRALLTDGTDFYAGTSQGVYKSNNGTTWTQLNLTANTKCLIKVNSSLFAGTSTGLYISTNTGGNWSQSISYDINSLAYGNNLLWMATNGTGFWLSTNSGTNWSVVGGPTGSYTAIALNGAEVYTSPSTGGVKHLVQVSPGVYQFSSRNGGFPTPLPIVNALVVTNTNLLAGATTGVWRAPISYVTNTESNITSFPSKFELLQNYPNPFNPTTSIRYQIPKEQIVTLKIFDITGREIETLVNEKQSPGMYEVNWKASKYSSGVYFYKLETKDYSEMKKMILVK